MCRLSRRPHRPRPAAALRGPIATPRFDARMNASSSSTSGDRTSASTRASASRRFVRARKRMRKASCERADPRPVEPGAPQPDAFRPRTVCVPSMMRTAARRGWCATARAGSRAARCARAGARRSSRTRTPDRRPRRGPRRARRCRRWCWSPTRQLWRDVRVRHQVVVVADHPSACPACVARWTSHVLAEDVAVADAEPGRRAAYARSCGSWPMTAPGWIDVVGADLGVARSGRRGHDPRARPDADRALDHDVRTDLGAGVDLGARVDDRRGMDRHLTSVPRGPRSSAGDVRLGRAPGRRGCGSARRPRPRDRAAGSARSRTAGAGFRSTRSRAGRWGSARVARVKSSSSPVAGARALTGRGPASSVRAMAPRALAGLRLVAVRGAPRAGARQLLGAPRRDGDERPRRCARRACRRARPPSSCSNASSAATSTPSSC